MRNIFTKKLRYIIALSSIAMLITFALPATQAFAAPQTCTWEGDSGNNWNTASNWLCTVEGARIPADGDSLVFPATGVTSFTSTNDIAGLDLDKIVIAGSNYVISGSAITLTVEATDAFTISGASNSFSINTTIDMTVTGSASIFSTGASNTISGNLIFADISTMNIGVSSAKTLTMSGIISGSSPNFIMSSDLGTVSYTGTNSFTSSVNIYINEGALISCGNNACFGDPTNDMVTTGAGTIITTGVRTLPYNIRTNVGTGLPQIFADDDLTLNGSLDINTDTSISENNVALKTITANTGGIDIASTKGLTLLGDGTYLSSAFDLELITGAGDLAIDNGRLDLGSSPAYNGDIIIRSNGFLENVTGDNLGTTTGGVLIQSGGVLRTSGAGTFTIDDDITVEGTGNASGSYSDGAIYNEGGNLLLNGDVTLSGDTTVQHTSNTGTTTFAGSITGTGNLDLIGDAVNGGIVLNGTTANDYVGDTNIYSVNVTASKTANVIAIPGDATVTAVPLHTARIFTSADEQIADDASIALDSDASTGALVISGGSSETVGTVTGDGLIQLGTVNDELIIGGGNVSGTFTGQVFSAANSAIIKIGSGTWNFQGLNQGPNYANYEIAEGTFLANPSDTSLELSNFTVTNGGTLKGTGSIGDTVVDPGGTLSTGNSPGCLTLSILAMDSGSIFAQEIEGSTACSGYDQTTVTGDAGLGGATLNMTITGTPTVGTVYTIITAGSVTGTFAGLANGATVSSSGNLFTINYTATSVSLTALAPVVTTIPAPTTSAGGTLPTTGISIAIALFSILLIAGGLLLVRRRKNTLYI